MTDSKVRNIDEIKTEYMTKHSISTLSSNDEKMIKTIFNLRTNYHEELKKRKCIKYLEPINVFKSPLQKKGDTTKPVTENINESVSQKEKSDVIYCSAFLMSADNKKCTAKAKPGQQFCGRHLPKNK